MLAFALTYLALTAIILARYVVIAGGVHLWLWRRGSRAARRLAKREPTGKTIRHEIKLSTISAFIYAFPGAWIVELWKAGGSAIYSGPIDDPAGWAYAALSGFLYLFVHDTYFYWTHRWMHDPKMFSWAHAGHHRSVQPTPWASFSFDPFEALVSAWALPLLALVVPIHAGVILGLLVIMTTNAVLNHAGWEVYPKRWIDGWFGQVFITATHHNQHHTKFTGNYGLYFRFWDRVMGTDREYPKSIRTIAAE